MYGALAVLVVLIIVILGVLAWYFFLRPSPQQTAASDAKTQPILQKFVSNDLKKRAFIVELNKGGYKVIFQIYSEQAMTRGREAVGWRALHDKPITETLEKAVETAQEWVHSKG